jgi:hypothetical protein
MQYRLSGRRSSGPTRAPGRSGGASRAGRQPSGRRQQLAVPPVDGPSAGRGGAARRLDTASTTSLLASYAPVRRSCAFGEPGLLGIGGRAAGARPRSSALHRRTGCARRVAVTTGRPGCRFRPDSGAVVNTLVNVAGQTGQKTPPELGSGGVSAGSGGRI